MGSCSWIRVFEAVRLFCAGASRHEKCRFQILMFLDNRPALRTCALQELENLNLCCMDDFARHIRKTCNNGTDLHHLLSLGFVGALDGWRMIRPWLPSSWPSCCILQGRNATRSKSGPPMFRNVAIEKFWKRLLRLSISARHSRFRCNGIAEASCSASSSGSNRTADGSGPG